MTELLPIEQLPFKVTRESGYSCTDVIVRNEWGIHARPSTMIFKKHKEYGLEAYLTKIEKKIVDGREVFEELSERHSCSSLMELISIYAKREAIVKIHVKGTNESAAEACRGFYDLIGAEDLESMREQVDEDEE